MCLFTSCLQLGSNTSLVNGKTIALGLTTELHDGDVLLFLSTEPTLGYTVHLTPRPIDSVQIPKPEENALSIPGLPPASKPAEDNAQLDSNQHADSKNLFDRPPLQNIPASKLDSEQDLVSSNMSTTAPSTSASTSKFSQDSDNTKPSAVSSEPSSPVKRRVFNSIFCMIDFFFLI
jgi:hypothetical protein